MKPDLIHGWADRMGRDQLLARIAVNRAIISVCDTNSYPERDMITTNSTRITVGVLLGLFCTNGVLAQKSGMNATVTIGVVEQVERVTLQSTGGGKGAAVGGTLGYASGSGKSKSKKRRNAIIGGAAGAALSSSGKSEGRQYSVRISDEQVIVVVSDQTEIQLGDCVSVEQSGEYANIRRQDAVACQPKGRAVMADVEAELIENANECAAVKQEILNAKTTEELELAQTKAEILCN